MTGETGSIKRICDNSCLPLPLLLLADPSVEMIRKYIDNSIGIVCELDSVIIGALLMQAAGPRGMEIMNIAVDEAHQKKGIGKRLLQEAVKTAKLMGMERLEICTGNSSVGQLLLYQKCGFRIVGVEPDFFRKNYPEKIFENGVECRDRIRLEMPL